MAGQTVTTDTDLESVIALGMLDREDVTIRNGAKVTCTQTPSILLGNIKIEEGELHIDGLNISSGNSINFVGVGGASSYYRYIRVDGPGTFRVTGDWFDIGTTDGTDSQVIDASSTGTDFWNNDFCVANFPMIQIETGRRIDFDNASGSTPAVGDMMYLTSDLEVMGKIKEVGSTYLIVWLLTGSLTDNDAIEVRGVVDNNGPDYQIYWTANVNNASGDIKEAGVYMEFGNCSADETNMISNFGSGYGGLVFYSDFGTGKITLGGSTTGGFVPPSGCNVRTPNVVLNTSDLTNYTAGDAYRDTSLTNASYLYRLYGGAGEYYMSVFNATNSGVNISGGQVFEAEYVGAEVDLGCSNNKTRFSLFHCVTVDDPQGRMTGNQWFGRMQYNVTGGTIDSCLNVKSIGVRRGFGGEECFDITIKDCIHTAGVSTHITPYTQHGLYINKVTGCTVERLMIFSSDYAEEDEAVNISNSNDIALSDILVSMTQDYTPRTANSAQAYDVVTVNGLSIVGFNIIGDGYPKHDFMYCNNVFNAKFRCSGLIDEKHGTAEQTYCDIAGVSYNLDFARIWSHNPLGNTIGFFEVDQAVKNLTVQNCSSSYTSGMYPGGIGGIRVKGLHSSAGDPGSNTQWSTNYDDRYGYSFYDVFRSDTVGTIGIVMIAPAASSEEVTVISGNPVFDCLGDLDMDTGDIIEFEQSYFAKGHTGFSGGFTACTGVSSWNADEWTNVDLYFQYQLEGDSWNGTWLDIRTVSNWTGITGDIEEGIKLKFRLEATGTQNELTMLLIDTTTTLADQRSNLYPIDQNEVDIEISGMAEGSVLSVYDTSDDSEIVSPTTIGATGIYTTTYVHSGTDINVIVKVRKGTSGTKYLPYNNAAVIGENGFSLIVNQVVDTIAT